MKPTGWLSLTALTAVGLGAGGVFSAAAAATFASTEVDQSRFVVMATAGGSRPTILEQVRGDRACWRESGGTVEPLMLNFDFTGICARATDRNGYSVRVAGQDLGLRYSLRTERVGNAVVLYAVPSDNSHRLEVGRTSSVPSTFGQIQLNSGWRLTRRVYNGQQLGHVYLTNDTALPTLVASATGRPSTPNLAPVASRPTPSQPSPAPIAANPPRVPTAGSPITIPVPPPASIVVTRPAPLPVTPPPATTRPTPTTPPMAGSPLPPPPAVARPGDIAVLPVPGAPPTPTGHTPGTLPSVGVNQGSWGNAAPVYSGTPQFSSPRLASDLGFSYRVVVNDSSPTAQQRIRSVVPDAFRTVINGQVVMQAGLFRDRPAAEAMMQQLSQSNLPATVIAVN